MAPLRRFPSKAGRRSSQTNTKAQAGLFLRAYSASPPPSFAPLTKPRQPLCGRISGLAGTSSPFFSIAKPLRGCLRGRSGRARGPQATGGRGAARPTPRSRPRRRAGSLWEYGSPPVGARLKVCQHRPRAKFSPKMAAQLQVKHYREKLQDLGGV